jgi:hypothetical protein
MINDDLVKCPLCGGFTHIQQPELVAMLNNASVREKVERHVAELLQPSTEDMAGAGVGKPEVRDFQKEIHKWNSGLPMWRRSPKE